MKYVMWILYGKYCIAICGIPMNVWYNFWIHTRVIIMHTGVHAMMILKCLRMRHAYDSDIQTNICNAFCIVLCAWKCNDAFVIVFRLGDADADSTCWVYPLLNLQFLQTCWSQFQRNDCTKGTLNLSKFINHSWDSVHSTISLTSIFMTIVYLPFVKSNVSLTTLYWEYIILPSEELTFTPKFRENLLEKTHRNWA